MNCDHEEHSLLLTEEEALGLLNIAMLSPMELTREQHIAVLKLSEFCRERLRTADSLPHSNSPSFPLQSAYPV